MIKQEKILIVDDEKGILQLLEITLKKERYHHITCATTGAETLSYVKNNEFDLILLDVMLPDDNGFDLCREIRKYSNTQIIFITSCSSDFDKLTGLGIGGDDYITKPFNPLEVVARIEALFRRQHLLTKKSHVDAHREEYDFGRITLNITDATLIVDGVPIECTAKELQLLHFFFKNPNRIFTSAQIYEHVWEDLGFGGEKTVAMHISRIRKKLEIDPKSPEMIINLRGIGYKFIPPKQGDNNENEDPF